ncbi:diguanylate cyclase [Shewanella sp. OPT22]|nr:diguanylate cyclase [Shewanella sp. OPT22]
MTMLFRQIYAFLFCIILSGIFAVSAWAFDGQNSQLNSSKSITSLAEKELIEIPDSHILLNSDMYGVSEGLSQNTVTSFTKDNNGFLWIGTINGLNRFDGTEFRHFTQEQGLPSAFIRSMYLASNGNIYIGTNQGLALYQSNKDKIIHLDIGEYNESPIWKIREFESNIYFSTDTSIIKLDNNKTTEIFKHQTVIDIKDFLIQDEIILIKTYNKNLLKVKNNKINTISSSVLSITKNGNKIYYSDQDGLHHFSTSLSKSNLISNTPYQQLSSYKREIFGLIQNSIHNISSKENIGTLDIEEFNNVTFNIFDDQFYVGTLIKGFVNFSESNNIVSKINITNKNVWGLARYKENLFISTDAKSIDVLDKNYKIINKIPTGLNGYKHISIHDGNLIFGNKSGLYKYIFDSKKTEKISNIPVSFIKSFNNKIFIGTETGYIHYINEFNIMNIYEISKNQLIYNVEVDKVNIYASTSNGLFKIHIPTNKIEQIHSDQVFSSCINDDTLYFATNSSIIAYSTIENTITSRIETKKNTYSLHCENRSLIATVQGSVLLIKDFNKVISINKKNGSQAEYNASPIVKFNSKYILAGVEGLTELSEKKVSKYLKLVSPPEIRITSLYVFNKLIKGENPYFKGNISNIDFIEINHSDYPFTFNFSSMNLNVNYQYRLIDLNERWISAYQNSATFTNLSPGNFIFEVKSIDLLTNKASTVKQIKIKILPPWWQSKIARAVYSLFAMLLFFLFLRALKKKRQIQKKIALSEERLKLSLWGSGDEMWDWDIETGKIYRSNMWESLEFPVIGQRANSENQPSNIHPMDRKRVLQHLEDHLHDKTEHFEISYRVKSNTNQWIWILDRAKVMVRSEDGTPLRMTGTIKNINDFKNTEEQLKLFGKAIENISEGMFILDHSFTFVEVNQACLAITQAERSDYIGKILKFDQYPDSYSHQIQYMLRNHGRWTNEVDAKRGDGTSFVMDLTIDAIYDDSGHANHYVAVFSDVSVRRQHEVELQKMSTLDVLTGLPNRSFLQVTLSNLVKRKVSNALLILDIDNFKKINDSLGHDVGDKLLQIVTQRIVNAVEGEANIFRLGGDEFAILVENIDDISKASTLANRIIDTFKATLEIDNTNLFVGASIGIVFYPDDETDEKALLRKAEVAMYSAKSAGGNRYHFYSESQNNNAIRQLEVENLIREGLAEDYFEVFYQPKVNVKSNKVVGMEALVRLIHPEQGIISPAEFIPLAEETGLIVELGDIVLEKSCSATQKWRLENDFNGRVAVNLSSRQFALPDLQERIATILEKTGLPAANLEIEITESTVIKHPERAIKVMQKLTEMGIHLALDDFGTGYSSLTYLKKFPINSLKIDKSFIDDIDKSDRDLKMVDSIITIAHNMGLSVVAEGVEEQSQLGILRALKCEEIQGYLFSKPLPPAEFQNRLI